MGFYGNGGDGEVEGGCRCGDGGRNGVCGELMSQVQVDEKMEVWNDALVMVRDQRVCGELMRLR